MTIYKTVQGDTWDLIAFKIFGTSHVMSKLMEANPEYMKVGIFGAGVMLKIPAINIVEVNDDLPPWLK